MNKFIRSTLFTLLASLSLVQANSVFAQEQMLDKVIAVVNEEIILKSELAAKVYEQANTMAAQNIPVTDADALARKVLDNMILEKLQLQRAAQLGIQANDEEINAQLQKIADENKISMFELRNRLNLQSPNGFLNLRAQIKQQIVIQKLREKEIISQAFVTESEIENYLKRDALEKSKKEYRLSHILISLPESSTPKQRETALQKIKNIKQRAEAGEVFSRLAVKYSDGSKALLGGDLGWLSEQQVPSFFTSALANLKRGEVSDIIQSPSGFHLIQLVNSRDSGNDKIKTEYNLFRFIVLSDDVDANNVPKNLVEITQQMDSIQDFQALFKKFPDIPEEVNKDSDLGWRTLDRIPTVIQADVAKMSPKTALPPLMTNNGWMLLYLDDVRETTESSDADRQQAIQTIRMRKANEMFDLWLRRMKDEAFIQIK